MQVDIYSDAFALLRGLSFSSISDIRFAEADSNLEGGITVAKSRKLLFFIYSFIFLTSATTKNFKILTVSAHNSCLFHGFKLGKANYSKCIILPVEYSEHLNQNGPRLLS